MPIRRPSSTKKMWSRGKRALRRTSLRVVDIGVLPLKVSGQLVRGTGGFIKKRGEKNIVNGKEFLSRKTVWRGRVTKIVGGSVERVGKTIYYPIVIWEDHANNERERMNIEARMQKIGWGEVTNVQGVPDNSVSFVPNRENYASQDKAVEEIMYDTQE